MPRNAQVEHLIGIAMKSIARLVSPHLVTEPMEIHSIVPTVVSIPRVTFTPDTQGGQSSPLVSPAHSVSDDSSIGAIANHPELSDDQLESVRQSYEEEIAQIHRYYQYAIEHLALTPLFQFD